MKRNIAVLCAAVVVLWGLLGGCVQDAQPSPVPPLLIIETTGESTEPSTEAPETQPLQTQSVSETEPLPPPQPTQPPIVEIHGLLELRDYLCSQQEAGIRQFSFRYDGGPMDTTAQNIARMGGYFYVEAYMEGGLCNVRVVEYPGDRMVEAYRSGNTAALSQEEQQALQIALDMVQQAGQGAADELELERRLFDAFRSHVSYNDGSTEITDPLSPPRYLTAVGALVDGSANCQGYADGFYVLASLAGFRTQRMHVDIPEGGHTVNVIYLDGAWYVVDATYNDLNDPSGVQVSYALLNVGRDKCLRYSWNPEMERYPIADQTDHHNFYYTQGSENTLRFADLVAMSQWILDSRQVYGTDSFYLMLEGQTATWQDLSMVLEQTAAAAGAQISYTIWHDQNLQDTYFHVLLR